MKRKNFNTFLFIGIFTFLTALFSPFIFPPKIIQGLNDFPSYLVYYLSRGAVKPLHLVAIAIDDHSLNKIPQRWPWRRPVYAELLKTLDKEKVRVVGFDLTFVGESENKDDDLALKEVLSNASTRVVLAYAFDTKIKEPILPLAQFKESAYAVGFVNAPTDRDGKTRRLRSFVKFKGDTHNSFPVALSAAYLNQEPQDIINRLSLFRDNSFFVNYLLKPEDVTRLSFCEVLSNLDSLKKKYGANFLRNALVLVYPEAEILHDRYGTPLGDMPGGFLHLNGTADIVSGRFIKEVKFLSIPFLVFSFIAIFYALRSAGFIFAGLCTFAVLLIDFCGLVLLNLWGAGFDYSSMFIFSLSFFVLGSLYKYGYFWAQLRKIKYKITLDPLSGLFNLRFFYYRLELEQKEIYFRKNSFLIFIYFEAFEKALEDLPLEKIKILWQEIQGIISLKKARAFWSLHSRNELIGYFIASQGQLNLTVDFLKNRLEALLRENKISSKVKIGYLRFNKEYAVKEMLFGLFKTVRESVGSLVFFKDTDLAVFLKSAYPKTKQGSEILETLGEDIEEKNQQLLLMIDDLNKEHAKTKEVFFQIMTSLVNALEARDAYTDGHSKRVAQYSLEMAESLGWQAEEKEKLKKAALLHDLGKIGIPDIILHKKTSLTDEEFSFIKKHSSMSVKILEPLKEFSEILPWILHHHEKWNGAGYPHNLAGNDIPLASQIISLADVFDALSTGRDYKKASSYEESLKEIERNKGIQFNPQLADIFSQLIRSSHRESF